MVVAAILQRLEHSSRLLSRFGSNFANGALSRCRDIRLLRIAANFFGGHGYFGDCQLRSKSIKLNRATKELNKAEYSHSVEDKQIDLCVLRPCRKPLGKAPVRFLSRSEGASKAAVPAAARDPAAADDHLFAARGGCHGRCRAEHSDADSQNDTVSRCKGVTKPPTRLGDDDDDGACLLSRRSKWVCYFERNRSHS